MTRWLLVLIATALTACAADGSSPSGATEAEATCEGKCDGVFPARVSSWFRRMDDLDTGDLLSAGSQLGTDALEGALRAGATGTRIDAPTLYALPEDARGDLTLRDLEQLSTGLMARFGERALPAQVNALRLAHLRESEDRVFAESSFGVHGSLTRDLGTVGAGFGEGGVHARLGFAGGELSGRMVRAFGSELDAHRRSVPAALAALGAAAIPRSVDEVRRMRPGESFGLRGDGWLGFNFGAGVPILVAQPGAGPLTYSVVLSGALRTRLEGVLDVELVRLDGGQVVVDVGTEAARATHASLAVDDGFGITGLLGARVDLLGREVDLGQLVERALARELSRRLSLVDARAAASGRSSRITVARFRFDLNGGDPELEAGLAQAMRGDLRLAQLLATRAGSGVRREVDFIRSGVSTVSHIGLDLLGMRFFDTTEAARGSAALSHAGGVETLLFDSLHREQGWFLSTRGHSRVASTAITSDPAGGEPRADVRLHLELLEGDRYLEREKIIDRIDPVLAALGGLETLSAVAAQGNHLEREVDRVCRSTGARSDCPTTILRDPTVAAMRLAGETAAREVTRDLDPAVSSLVTALARLRTTTQATFEPAALWVGPPGSVVVSQRFDQAAVDHVMDPARGDDLRSGLEATLRAVQVDRGLDPAAAGARITGVLSDARGPIDRIVAWHAAYADTYQRARAAEAARLSGVGVLGPFALELRIPLTRSGSLDLDGAYARPLSKLRADLVRDLFDTLATEAAAIRGVAPEQLVAMALLALVPSELVDVRFDLDLDLRDRATQRYDHYRAAGYAPVDLHAQGDAARSAPSELYDIDAVVRVHEL